MMKFKQKNYAFPLLGAMTGVSILQGHNANKEAEAQTEEMERHNKKMEKIAKEQAEEDQKNFGALPIGALRTIAKAKNSNAGLMAQDLWKVHGNGLKKAAGFGAGFAGLDYIGNRAAQSWKDHDEGNDGKTGKALLKVAGTAAAIGGGIYAAKKGKLGFNSSSNVPNYLKKDTIQNYMTTGSGGKALDSLKKTVNPIVRNESGNINKGATLGKVALNGAFASMPVLGYAAQRNQQKDQVENQINYSEDENKSGVGKKILGGLAVAGTVAGGIYGARKGIFGAGAQKTVGNALAGTGSYLQNFKSTKNIGDKLISSGSDAYATGQTKKVSDMMSKAKKTFDADKFKQTLETTRATRATEKPASLLTGTANAISKPLNWFGMMGTKGGVNAMKKTGQKLANEGKSEWSRNVGNWIGKSDKNAALATIGGGVGAIAAGSTAIGLGDKAVKSATKAVDSGAYDIEKEQNQKVYSKITFREKGETTDKKTGLRTKFYKKKTKINEPGFKSESISVTERTFTKWDQTDQLKNMTDADILAEQKRKTSSLNLGQSVGGALGGAALGGIAGKSLGNLTGMKLGGKGALAGAAIGGMAGMDKQTRDKTLIGSGLGAAAGLGLGLLTKKPNLYKAARNGALIGGTVGVMTGVASGSKQNKENQFFNDRLEQAQSKALKREKADWKNNINNREGYTS